MQIRHVQISHFRGIQRLDWKPADDLVCLVGHGDSTKSSILDAIELALARYNVSVLDTDFYMLDMSTPIQIDVTIGQLPSPLLSESKFGLYLRGWNAENGAIEDEPGANLEPVLTVRFEVDATLEPSWKVITDRQPEGRAINQSDRERLGVVRIDSHVDRHLSWGRGSALMRTTETTSGVKHAVTEAQKQARKSVEEAELVHLQSAAKQAEDQAKKMGARVQDGYRPSLTSLQMWGSQALLGLHDGPIPLSRAGLGTRRLVAIGLQSLAVPEGGIVLVDEIENALEPHRLRHLLKTIRPEANKGQVLFTTHSAIALMEVTAEDIHFVRSDEGTTHITRVPSELQDVIRATPEALLGLRVLVAEGRTELGLMRACEQLWEQTHNLPLTHEGGVVVDGGGSSAPMRSEKLKRLGISCALLADSNNPAMNVGNEWQATTGVKVIQWPGQMCTEQRLMCDLPWDGLKESVALAVEFKTADHIRMKVAAQLGVDTFATALPDDWRTNGQSEIAIRSALGKVADAEDWYKDVERGERLGSIVVRRFDRLSETDTGKTIKLIGNWLYDR